MSEEIEENGPAEPGDGEARVEKALVPYDGGGAPERRGPGRPRGSLNQTTVAMRHAIATVFADMPRRHQGEGSYPHFLEWAEANPTEFYRIAARQMPVPFETAGRTIGVVVFKGINDGGDDD